MANLAKYWLLRLEKRYM